MENSKKIIYILGTGFGCGYFPKFPGSFASFITICFLWFFQIEFYTLILLSIVIFFIGIPAATIIEKIEGKDSRKIVIDEITGQVITFITIPLTGINVILGFILFRTFDIIKPYPVNKSQKLRAGWGVMIDDVLAGLYSNIILQIILYFMK